MGLVAALGAAAARITVGKDGSGWHAVLDSAVQLPQIPGEVEAAAYQIAVEALTNACRHSAGTTARVRLGVDASGTALILEILDDGTGIQESAQDGVGLKSMAERAARVGGRLVVSNHHRGGTAVRAELPLTAVGQEQDFT